MKILQIVNDLKPGGAEKLIDEIVPILNSQNDVTCDLLLLGTSESIYTQLKESKVNVSAFKVSNYYNPILIKKIYEFILDGEYDIVHSHLFPTNYWVSISSLFFKKNKPVFITTEHSTSNRRRQKPIFKYIERIIYSRFSVIIAISEGVKENLTKWLNYDKGNSHNEKISVVYNGINLNDFHTSEPYKKSKLSSLFSQDTVLLCMVGRFTEKKDQKTIIESLEYLSPEVSLMLIGDGPNKKTLEKLVKEKNLNDRVVFLGIRNDIPRLMKTADINIVSSNIEGFGLVAVEGMATGKPLIASDIPGLREVVQGAGLLFEKNNPVDLSHKINCLLNNTNQYNSIKNKCLKRSNDFDIRKMAEDYLGFYQKVLHRD